MCLAQYNKATMRFTKVLRPRVQYNTVPKTHHKKHRCGEDTYQCMGNQCDLLLLRARPTNRTEPGADIFNCSPKLPWQDASYFLQFLYTSQPKSLRLTERVISD